MSLFKKRNPKADEMYQAILALVEEANGKIEVPNKRRWGTLKVVYKAKKSNG